MKILKRDGQYEEVAFDKITSRLRKIVGKNAQLTIDLSEIALKVIASIHDGISSARIDDIAVSVAASMISEHPDFDTVASRLYVDTWHKRTPSDVLETYTRLERVVSPEFMACITRNAAALNAMIDYRRDLDFDYFGLSTLEKLYVLRDESGVVVERPQSLFLRVAVALHNDDLKAVKETYVAMSKKKFTHASPTLFNAGTRSASLASCFLQHMPDSLDGIFKVFGDVGQISKLGGGIGIDISGVRGRGSRIESTNGKSDGILPMLQVADSVISYVNQCFIPETKVYTKNNGVIRMDEVAVGESLVTKDGSFKTVNEVFVRQVSDEPMLTITPKFAFEGVTCTKVHEIFALRGQAPMLSYAVIRNRLEKGSSVPDFCPASELTVGDFMGFPIPKDTVDYDFSEEFCRFYAIMLADGHAHTRAGKYVEYGVTLNMTTKAGTLAFVKSVLESRDIHYWTHERQGAYSVRWTGAVDYLYDDAGEKRMDPRFLNLPRAKTVALVRGLLETDGSVLGEIYFHTTSIDLLMSMRYLCLRLGVLTHSDEIRPGENITTKKLPYALRIPKHVNLAGAATFTPYTEHAFFEFDGILYTRITSIRESRYSGGVYDFNMESNHNYTTDCGLVHNSGRRKGSMAAYIGLEHPDIMDFLDLRRPGGDENARTRNLFLAMWIPDLFMRRVRDDQPWSLFDPHAAPGLNDVHSDAYDKLYARYEAEGRAVKVVKAREVWAAITRSQIETGQPYILYKDHANRKSNQQNLGTIRCSNLCVAGDTRVLTDAGHLPIESLRDQMVNVWNGREFSETIVRQTGTGQKLVRVQFSNGSDLDCTPYHKFYLVDRKEPVPANQLCVGDVLIDWDLVSGETISGVHVTAVIDENEYGDTFCFTEPLRGMGMFNGVLAGNCAEIIEYTSPSETAVCTLASVNLNAFVTPAGTYDFADLMRTTKIVARNLDRVIDVTTYPVPEAETSNLRHRPIGIGVQGLADVFARLGYAFDSPEASRLNSQIFEALYFAAIETSIDLAAELGVYESYEWSPASNGLLQFDLWDHTPSDAHDWTGLKRRLKRHGLRNSLSVALMPTASTAQILGNNEACEAFTSMIYVRRTLAGEFTVVNTHLVKKLLELGMWCSEMKNRIIANNGSIAKLDEIPEDVRAIYKTVWEIKQKNVIDLASCRGPFVCQSQSMNLFVSEPTAATLNAMHFYSWQKGLKTGQYYLRSKPASHAKKITVVHAKPVEPDDESESCVMCSA